MLKTKANLQKVQAYEELLALQNEVKSEMKELADDTRVKTSAQKYLAFKKALNEGDFGTAKTRITESLTLLYALKGTVLKDQSTAVAAPKGASPDDKQGLTALKSAVDNAITTTPDKQKIAAGRNALSVLTAQANELSHVVTLSVGLDTLLKNVPKEDELYTPAVQAIAKTASGRKAGKFDVVRKSLETERDKLAPRLKTLGDKIPATPEIISLQVDAMRAELERVIESEEDQGKREKAEAVLKAIELAIASGPLSRNDGRHPSKTDGSPISAKAAANYLEAIQRDPVVGAKALDIACRMEDAEDFANDVSKLAKRTQDGFGYSKNGKVSPTILEYSQVYAGRMLEGALRTGPGFLKEFEEYASKGKHGIKDVFPKPQENEGPGHCRSRTVAASLFDEQGDFVFDKEKVGPLKDHMRFHFEENYFAPAGETAGHVARTLDYLETEEGSKKIGEVLKEVKVPRKGTAGDNLLRQTLGLGVDDEVSKQQVREALLTSLLSPISQGPVGSCFATAPVMDFRERDPAGFLDRLKTLVTDGTFAMQLKTGKLNVPAVTRLPKRGTKPGEDRGDPLIRSFEYTVATAGTLQTESKQRTDLQAQTNSALLKVKGKIFNRYKTENAQKLIAKLQETVKFVYDPTAKAESGRGDGRSTTGRFILMAGDQRIESPKAYDKLVLNLAKELFPNAEGLEKELEELSLNFGGAPGTGRPWDLESGGFSDGPLEAIWNEPAEQTSLTDTISKKATTTQRSAKILEGLLGTISGKKSEHHTIRVEGIHAFNAVPNHPSVAGLQGKKGSELAKAIDETLVKPGAEIANKAMPVKLVQRLFDEALEKAEIEGKQSQAERHMIGEKNAFRRQSPDQQQIRQKDQELEEKYKEQIEEYGKSLSDAMSMARRLRPTTELTAKALSDLVKNSLKPFTDLRSTNGDAGAAKKIEAGLAVASLTELAPPEVVIADTNWGDENMHIYFVMTTDPVSGEFGLWERREPEGRLRKPEARWLNSNWAHYGLKGK